MSIASAPITSRRARRRPRPERCTSGRVLQAPPRAQVSKTRPTLRSAAIALVAALALAAIGASGLATLRLHPRFAVTRVVLDGVPEARRAEVEELTDRWIGVPLLFVDLDSPIAALSSRSWVRSASARRV